MSKYVYGTVFALFLLNSGGAFAAGNCFEVGQNYAADNGVSLVAAEETTDGGRAACKIVVLKDASGGSRPKREVVILPN